MDIFNHPSQQEYAERMSVYRFVPHAFCRDIRISSNSGRVFYIQSAETSQQPITLQTTTDISNPFNFFYYEAEIASFGKSITIGFGNSNFAPNKAPGKSKFGSFSIGFSVQEDRCALHYRKNKVFERVEKMGKTFGIGLFSLKPAAFITIDGLLVTEVKLQRLSECCPTITLTAGSDVTFNFENPIFDVRKYIRDLIERFATPTNSPFLNAIESSGIFGHINVMEVSSPVKNSERSKNSTRSEKRAICARQERILGAIGEYLEAQGFNKTLKVLEKNQKITKTKTKSLKDLRNARASPVRKTSQGSIIREEIIQRSNWRMLLDKSFPGLTLTLQMQANITLRAFLKEFYATTDETKKILLFKEYGDEFARLKNEEIIGSKSKLEEIVSELICGDRDYSELLNSDNKNLILASLIRDRDESTTLESILKYLGVLLRQNASINGFEPGFSFDNLTRD